MDYIKVLTNTVFILVLLRIAHKDMKTKTIPNAYLFPLVLLVIISYSTYKPVALVDGILGALVISVPMLIFTIINPGSFGGGDVKLLAVAGAFLGVKGIVTGFVIGITWAALYIILKYLKKNIQLNTTIPLGPFLAGGCILALFQ